MDEVVDVDGCPSERRRVLLGPGQEEEVADESLEPFVLPEQRVGDLGPVGLLTMRERDAELDLGATMGLCSSCEASPTKRR